MGRADIVRRQLDTISKRLRDAKSPAVLEQWSEAVIPALCEQWDDDLGGRSTRDFIEENVVEAIAEALDGFAADDGPEAALELDVEQAPHDPAVPKFVCRRR